MFLFILKAAVMIAILGFYLLSEVRVEKKKILVKIDVGLLKEKCKLSRDLFQNYWISGKSEKEDNTREQYARDKVDYSYIGSPADVDFYSGPWVTVETEEFTRGALQNDESFMSEPLDNKPLKTSKILQTNYEQSGGRKIETESLEDRIIDTDSSQARIIDTESFEDRTIHSEVVETDPSLNKQAAGNIETESLDSIPYSTQTTGESEVIESEGEQTLFVPADNIADMSKQEESLDGLTRNSVKHERITHSTGNHFEIAEITNRPSQKEEFFKMLSQIVRKSAEELGKVL
uniref:Uncharacterized protein n=1 Tax=Cacopsylla melanoneura TaxID=428564 RepID=A0A8D9BUK7_9HEMI